MSQQSRVHGASFVKRGHIKVTILESENDTTSQVDTHLAAFNSRHRVSGTPSGRAKVMAISTHGEEIAVGSRGNDNSNGS